METCDILADHVNIRRPVPLEQGIVIRTVTECRDVIEQSVEPDVDRLFLVERHRDAPAETLAGDRNVLQAGLDKIENFIPAAFRLDETRILAVMSEQPVTEVG